MLVVLALVAGCGGSDPAGSTGPVTPVATTVTLTPALSLLTGQTGQLTATVKDQTGAVMAGQTVTWQSQTAGIATVSSSGLVTAVAAGAGSISATVGSAVGTIAVTVAARAPTAMTLSPTAPNVTKGDTLRIMASVTDQAGDPLTTATVTWQSSATNVATVSTTGLVTALAGGSTTITATAGSISTNATVTVDDPPGPYTIATSLDIVSVAYNTTDTVKVWVTDDDTGAQIGFQYASPGSCVSVTSNGTTELYIYTAQSNCTQNILIDAPGTDKIITARTYEPGFIDLGDGLLMKYTNQWTQVYTDGAWHSSGLTPSRAFRPVTGPPGWYSVGDHLQNNYDWIITDLDVPAILLYDVAGNNLAAPTDYVEVWDNRITGCIICSNRSPSASWWKPVCPTGFEPLGSVAAASATKPSTDLVRCVSNRYTTRAEVEERFAWYSDMNSGSDGDLRMYMAYAPVTKTARPDGRATMYARSQFACPGYLLGSCDTNFFNLLLVPMTVVERGAPEPELRQGVQLNSQPRDVSSALIRVPFTVVPSLDPTCGTAECATAGDAVASLVQEPGVYLKRSASYTPLSNAYYFNVPGQLHIEFAECWTDERSTSFTQSVGLSITTSVEAEFEPITVGVAVTLSTEFGWTQSVAIGYQTCTTSGGSWDVPAGLNGRLVGVRQTFAAFTESGAPIGTPMPLDGGDDTVIQPLLW